jgi:MGT family glycosyltransferase
MRPTIDQLCRAWRPELILREPCEYASAVVAAERAIAVGQVAISVAEVELASIRHAAPALEEYRPGLTGVVEATPYLTSMPRSLDPSAFQRTFRFKDVGHAPAPLPDWWAGSPSPLVYLTLGTVLGHLSGAAALYETALQGLASLEDVRVLMTVGRHFDPTVLGTLPDNVHVERWVEQTDVLAAADVVVCHGGSGTTYGALAAGVPLVVVPVLADQFENGRRVGAFGAGVMVDRPTTNGRRQILGPADASRIAEAARTVLEQPRYAEAAGALAREVASEPDPDEVLASLIALAR